MGRIEPFFAAAAGDDADDAVQTGDIGDKVGLLPRQRIRALARRHMIQAVSELEDNQFQPASLDLRLGSRAYRVRASFLPGSDRDVATALQSVSAVPIDITDGAVLERGCVYVVELQEVLKLPVSISGAANPKSSAGRLDLFTRLITDKSEMFDQVVAGYEGPLYAEILPRTFPVKVRKGSRLSQLRFRRRNPNQGAYVDFRLSDRELIARHETDTIVDGPLTVRNGLVLRVDLGPTAPGGIVGYRAQRYTDIIDIDRVGAYRREAFWEPIQARPDGDLILDPDQFYILASKEKVHIPGDLAAEMVPIDPGMGEFRVHYAGFFDPGFGHTEEGRPGSRAVLEVRSHEVPFRLSDGQIVGRLVFEQITETPDLLYGEGLRSSYQGQGLKLSKHFID